MRRRVSLLLRCSFAPPFTPTAPWRRRCSDQRRVRRLAYACGRYLAQLDGGPAMPAGGDRSAAWSGRAGGRRRGRCGGWACGERRRRRPFTLLRVDAPQPRDEVFDSFDERAEDNDHFELFTFPYADSALVLERNRVEGPPRPRGRLAAYLNDIVLENWALEALSAAGRLAPRAIPRLSRLAPPPAPGGETAARHDRVVSRARRGCLSPTECTGSL